MLTPFVRIQGIDIIRMQCVLYDHVFANDIVAQHPNYPAMQKAAAKEKLAKEGKRSSVASSSVRKKGSTSSSKSSKASTSATSASTSASRGKRSTKRKHPTPSSEGSESESASLVNVPASTNAKKRKLVGSQPGPSLSTRRSARVSSKPQKKWVEESSDEDDEEKSVVLSSKKKSVLTVELVARAGGLVSRGSYEGGDDEGDLSYVSEE